MFGLDLEAETRIPSRRGVPVLDVEDGNKFFRHVLIVGVAVSQPTRWCKPRTPLYGSAIALELDTE